MSSGPLDDLVAMGNHPAPRSVREQIAIPIDLAQLLESAIDRTYRVRISLEPEFVEIHMFDKYNHEAQRITFAEIVASKVGPAEVQLRRHAEVMRRKLDKFRLGQ